MICILRRDDKNEVHSWILARDCRDAEQKAFTEGDFALADMLRNMAGDYERTMPKRQDLPSMGLRYTVLKA